MAYQERPQNPTQISTVFNTHTLVRIVFTNLKDTKLSSSTDTAT